MAVWRQGAPEAEYATPCSETGELYQVRGTTQIEANKHTVKSLQVQEHRCRVSKKLLLSACFIELVLDICDLGHGAAR